MTIRHIKHRAHPIRYCIDCSVELTAERQSRHQPTIRCLSCFEEFHKKVSAILERLAGGGTGSPPSKAVKEKSG